MGIAPPFSSAGPWEAFLRNSRQRQVTKSDPEHDTMIFLNEHFRANTHCLMETRFELNPLF